MAKKPTVNLIGSGYASKDLLNNNFTELRDAFDNTLSLDGSTPNAMGADLDMNSKNILNVGTLRVDHLDVDGTDFDALAAQVAADAQAAAANIDKFEEVYLGAKDTDPTVDNDGNPLQAGALYVNTGSNSLLYYDGVAWITPTQAATKVVASTGDGTTTDYALGTSSANEQSVFVYVDGVYQNKDGYSISGSTLTFSEAPPLNAAIEFVVFTTVAVGSTSSDLVTYNQGGIGAVDTTVQAKLREIDDNLSISLDGNVTVDNGNLVIGTSGKGIDFSATPGTGTSELFDDYEEGTWTPSLTASGGGSASYSRQNGRYTKIGNTVFAYFQMSASKGTLSGSVSISGLPFTSINLNGIDAGSVSFNRVQRFVATFNPYGHVTGDSTSIGLFKGNTNESTDPTSDGVPLDAADLNTTSTFRNYCFGVAIYHTS